LSWSKYYNKDVKINEFLGNLYSHKEFLTCILNYEPKKVLEIGCGTAGMSIFLSYLGLDITAIDNDKNLLKKQKEIIKKFNSRVNLQYADAFSLPFKDNSFDLVFHQGFFEHFSNQEIYKLLKEQLRVSKIVVFSVPNNFYPQKDFGNERLMSKKQWEEILKDFKLELSTNYSKKYFPKFYIPKAFIQYMAIIKNK